MEHNPDADHQSGSAAVDNVIDGFIITIHDAQRDGVVYEAQIREPLSFMFSRNRVYVSARA